MTLRNSLLELYFRLEKLLAPRLKFSQEIYEEVLREQVPGSEPWLDLGCGHRLLPPWRAREEAELLAGKNVFGIDYDLPSLVAHPTIRHKARADVSALPFRDSTFELVTANMVVEHLEHPLAQFREVHRILRPGGRFLFHTPNLHGYTTRLVRMTPEFLKKRLARVVEGRKEEDVFRTYYRANDLDAIQVIAQQSGFEVEQSRRVASSAALAIFPPLNIIELLWIRFLLTHAGRAMRPSLIVVLRKLAVSKS